MQPVIVGFDGSEHGRDALVLARTIARALEARLIVVTAYAPAESLWAPGTAAPLADEERASIGAVAETLLADGVDHEWRAVASPSAAGALQACAEQESAQLIVVGSSHRGRLGRVMLGTVTEEVLDASPCAVLIASAGLARSAPIALARIGVGFDDTPESQHALAVAAALAREVGAELDAVWAAHLAARALPLSFAGYLAPSYFREVRAEVKARLTAAVEALGPGLEVRTEIASGEAIGALRRRTARMDLLVLGSRGYGPLRRVLLGSVSRAVIRDARCPVLVVGRGGADLDSANRGLTARESSAVPAPAL